MQDNEQLFMQNYFTVSSLLTGFSLVMYLVCAFVVLASGRTSTERTLIGIGAVLQAIGVVFSLGISIIQRFGPHQGIPRDAILLVFVLSHLISVVGAALGLYGAVRALNRASNLEMHLEDRDDER